MDTYWRAFTQSNPTEFSPYFPKRPRQRSDLTVLLLLLSHLIDAPSQGRGFLLDASVWRVDADLDSRGRMLLVDRRKTLYGFDTRPVLEEMSETIMVRAALFALVIGSAGSSAVALPALPPDHSNFRPDPVVEVKIVCAEDGQCNRPPRRRPVTHCWVYGDGAFFGPGSYSGPGYYGSSGSHWRWFPFFGF